MRDGHPRRLAARARNVHFKPREHFVHLGGERRRVKRRPEHEEASVRTPHQSHVIGFAADAEKPRRQHALVSERLRPMLELLRVTTEIPRRNRNAGIPAYHASFGKTPVGSKAHRERNVYLSVQSQLSIHRFGCAFNWQ